MKGRARGRQRQRGYRIDRAGDGIGCYRRVGSREGGWISSGRRQSNQTWDNNTGSLRHASLDILRSKVDGDWTHQRDLWYTMLVFHLCYFKCSSM